MPHDTPKPPGYTRFVCISDTHSRTDSIQMPYGDVFIHAGDFTELGLPSEVKKFNDWLGQHLWELRLCMRPLGFGGFFFSLTGSLCWCVNKARVLPSYIYSLQVPCWEFLKKKFSSQVLFLGAPRIRVVKSVLKWNLKDHAKDFTYSLKQLLALDLKKKKSLVNCWFFSPVWHALLNRFPCFFSSSIFLRVQGCSVKREIWTDSCTEIFFFSSTKQQDLLIVCLLCSIFPTTKLMKASLCGRCFSSPRGVLWTHHKGAFFFLKCFLLRPALPHSDNFKKNADNWFWWTESWRWKVDFHTWLTQTRTCQLTKN